MDVNYRSLVRYGVFPFNTGTAFRIQAALSSHANRTFFRFEGRSFSYRATLAISIRYANFFRSLRKRMSSGWRARLAPLHIGLYLENTPEFIFTVFGAALDGDVVFGLNTGFRGETLARVLRQAEVDILITSSSLLEHLLRALEGSPELSSQDIYLVEDELSGATDEFSPAKVTPSGAPEAASSAVPRPGPNAVPRPASKPDGRKMSRLESALEALHSQDFDVYRPPPIPLNNLAPLMILYTSGTTGTPKGVVCSQIKLIGAGLFTLLRVHLTWMDRGYICMPLFHANAWFLGIMPLMAVGGSFLLRRRFSARAFEEDILEHGVTYMSYVGQPLHYILAALERKYGSGEAVERALARHPKNRFRIAHGNGAPPVDRRKFTRYLGLKHVYELYGATEGVINTVHKPGDPPDSVGSVFSSVVILDEQGRECPPGKLDSEGRLLNYKEAVGEIARKITTANLNFDGYFNNDRATGGKYRDGYYRSGDLGHICVFKRKRYLYFDGRTDDWIRKDGENFSAENVTMHVLRFPPVVIAAAYGVPSEVSDEKVMAAIGLREGEGLEPKALFEHFEHELRHGGMDRRWMPDFIRVVKDFPMSPTQKILIRELKGQTFNLEAFPDLEIWFRERGDTTYRRFELEDYRALLKRYDETGRRGLLEPR